MRLRRAGSRISVAVIKSWWNGWTTSHRLHEQVIHPCIFGCKTAQNSSHSFDSMRARDSWHHYAVCPNLRSLLSRALPECPLATPFDFLALSHHASLLPLAVSFDLYHSIKNDISSLHSVLRMLREREEASAAATPPESAETFFHFLYTRASACVQRLST